MIMKKRKGFNLVELLVVMIIIAILVLVAFFSGKKYMTKAYMTNVQNDFHNIEVTVTQMLLEHPEYINLKSTTTNFVSKCVSSVNRYLAEEVAASGTSIPVTLAKLDPWANDYRVYFITDDTNSKYFRFCVVSNGPNTKAHADAGKIDKDDLVLVMELKNGEVKSKMYGFTEDNTDGTSIASLVP